MLCKSIYSDMSKRFNSTPKLKANCLSDFGFANARGDGKQVAFRWVFRFAQTGAGELDRTPPRDAIAVFLPEDHRLQIAFQIAQGFAVVLALTDFGGMRAILATVNFNIRRRQSTVLRFSGVSSICDAPASSITSIALSGRLGIDITRGKVPPPNGSRHR